eukprot:TRINITY_DN113580_c0_g1_i1.p1 TRINITY_DN113580_c0_g1~~TRINITY_DN113580_c0_g1_i1.p1  ORF type:complete len:254 (+),score=32.87 TRINITY_DN113580_c0_g1_i1:102-764(+)
MTLRFVRRSYDACSQLADLKTLSRILAYTSSRRRPDDLKFFFKVATSDKVTDFSDVRSSLLFVTEVLPSLSVSSADCEFSMLEELEGKVPMLLRTIQTQANLASAILEETDSHVIEKDMQSLRGTLQDLEPFLTVNDDVGHAETHGSSEVYPEDSLKGRLDLQAEHLVQARDYGGVDKEACSADGSDLAGMVGKLRQMNNPTIGFMSKLCIFKKKCLWHF